MSEYNIKFRSNYLQGNADLTVIVPNPFVGDEPEPFYSSGKKYPVLWLFHGGSDTYADWISYTTVPRLAIERNTIIIAPEAPNSDFMNQPKVGEGYPYYDFFNKELMPFIYNWFPASSDPMDNFLAGNSMGCDAVWRYGLLKPDLFACIAPLGSQPLDYRYLEQYRSMSDVEFRQYAANSKIPSAYGAESTAMKQREINNICKYPAVHEFLDSIENTMLRFEEAAAGGKLPKVFLIGGTAERNPQLARFKEKVEDMNIKDITFDLVNAATYHSEFWENAVEKFMEFVGLHRVESAETGVTLH